MGRHFRETPHSYLIRYTLDRIPGTYSAGTLKVHSEHILVDSVEFFGGKDQEAWLRAEIRKRGDEFQYKSGARWTTATNTGLAAPTRFSKKSLPAIMVRTFKMMNMDRSRK